MVDEKPFFAETKGGTIYIRPRGVIVTSNYDVQQLWPDDLVPCEAIHRRFVVCVARNRDELRLIQWKVPEPIKNADDEQPPLTDQVRTTAATAAQQPTIGAEGRPSPPTETTSQTTGVFAPETPPCALRKCQLFWIHEVLK